MLNAMKTARWWMLILLLSVAGVSISGCLVGDRDEGGPVEHREDRDDRHIDGHHDIDRHDDVHHDDVRHDLR